MTLDRNTARQGRQRAAANEKGQSFSPVLFTYHFDFLLELDVLDLKKLPMKLSNTQRPKACQKVKAKATPNNPSTQLTINIPIQASKHIKPNTKANTSTIAKNVPMSYHSLLYFSINIITFFYLFVNAFLFLLLLFFLFLLSF